MSDSKIEFKNLVVSAVEMFRKEKGVEIDAALFEKAAVENPPKPEMGDLGVPMFVFAKSFGSNPAAIASEIVKVISSDSELSKAASSIGDVLAVGPYVNVKLDKSASAASILSKIEFEGD